MALALFPSRLSLTASPRPQSHSPPLYIPRPPCLNLRTRRRSSTSISASVRQDTTVWSQAPLSLVSPAAESLFHVIIDVSYYPDLAASHTRPGQYLQLRVSDAAKPAFLAIASPPSVAASKGELHFLVKTVAGSTAELLCGLRKGDVVELSEVMGKGFNVDAISPPESFQTVLIFATGSGIRLMPVQLLEVFSPSVKPFIPIRSLIEAGFNADARADVRLYYGARNLQRMAYQDRFNDWESSGVQTVPVLSQPDDRWEGERGYVQAAFARAKKISDPLSTGAVLCGQKQMAEEITSILTTDGVPKDKILMNF